LALGGNTASAGVVGAGAVAQAPSNTAKAGASKCSLRFKVGRGGAQKTSGWPRMAARWAPALAVLAVG
jgi:hypothetical protein